MLYKLKIVELTTDAANQFLKNFLILFQMRFIFAIVYMYYCCAVCVENLCIYQLS